MMVLREGDRVMLSKWQMNMLSKDMRGVLLEFGHPDTLRHHTAKVRWDNGHNDQWWPVTMLRKES